MKYAARTESEKGFPTFGSVMSFVSARFFNSHNTNKALDFMHNLGEYLETTKYPCDRIVIDAFLGYSNRFGLRLEYQGKKVAWLQIKVNKNGTIFINNNTYESSVIRDMFHNILETYFDSLNTNLLENKMAECGIKKGEEVSVTIVSYHDYKPDNEKVVCGTIDKIFEDYTNANDRLTYCNGDYYNFKDEKISELYSLYTDSFKGNYFLACAVKRGAIID